jgi:P27 family predicted phage terminase small subunit
MGRRGPAPTPTAILRLRGSPLAKRNRHEPKGPPGKPRCPEWLDDDAKAAWRHLIPQLDLMGVLTRIDGNALARYCRLWSRWRKAEAFIDKNGEMYPLKDDHGKVKCFQQFPQVSIAAKLAQ